MAKTKISEFSTTANNNSDINSINISEGCAPSGINDAIRELMRQLKEFQTGGAGDSVNSGGDFSVATNKFTVASASGNTAVAGTLAVTGTTTLTGALAANGNATLGDSSGDTVTIKGTPTLEVNPTLSGGTANGVLFLNGSKVATSGSALTFDGTNLGVNATPASAGGYTFFYVGGTGSSKGVMHATDGTVGVRMATAGNSLGYIGTTSNHSLVFTQNDTEAMRLTSSSLYTASGINVGIGTSSPSTKLQVAGNVYLSGAARNIYAENGSGIFFNGLNGFNSGIFSGASGNDLNFNTGTGSTTMYLNSSGNLGLGVTPSAWAGSKSLSLSASGAVYGDGVNYDYTAGISQNAYRASSTQWNYRLSSASAARFDLKDSTFAWYQAAASGTAGNAISFTQAMTLNASGNLLLGQTTSFGANGGLMEIYTSDNYNGAPNLALNVGANNTGGIYLYFTNAAGTKIGSVTQASSTSVAYNTTSDYRLKDNIQPMVGALERVQALKPVTYTWKEDGSDGEGFIAHELQAIIPKAVTGNKDAVDASGKPNYQSVDNSFLVATLVSSIQELKAEFDAYKATHP